MRQIVFLFYFLYNDNREKMNTNIFLPNNITIILINQSNTVFHIAPFKIHLNRNQCNDVTESGSLCTNLVYYCEPTYKYARNS
jgi:hypothetical protein